MTEERLKEIKTYAEERLRTGDILAAYTLETVLAVEEAQAEAKRLQDIVETYDERFVTLYDEKGKEIAWYKERSQEFDDFALAIGYAERPEGQSGVYRMSGPQLVEQWKARDRALDDAHAELRLIHGEYAQARPNELMQDALVLANGALKQEVENLKLQLDDRADSEYHLREALRLVNERASVLRTKLEEAVHLAYCLLPYADDFYQAQGEYSNELKQLQDFLKEN